jgi:uncharacterized damage-inducible protein DinB
MREAERIADQLWRSLQGEAWHGPALMELLRDVTPKEAAARPVSAAHSIWELVDHVAAWSQIVERRLQGEAYDVSDAESFPAVAGFSEAVWEGSRSRLVAVTEALRERVLRLDEAQLEQAVAGKKSSVYFLLHGLVQHNLYHAGQIALLKRALRGQGEPCSGRIDLAADLPRQFIPHMPAGPAPQAQELPSKRFASLAEPLEVCAAKVENLRSTAELPHPEHATGSLFLASTSSSKVVPHCEQWYS